MATKHFYMCVPYGSIPSGVLCTDESGTSTELVENVTCAVCRGFLLAFPRIAHNVSNHYASVLRGGVSAEQEGGIQKIREQLIAR